MSQDAPAQTGPTSRTFRLASRGMEIVREVGVMALGVDLCALLIGALLRDMSVVVAAVGAFAGTVSVLAGVLGGLAYTQGRRHWGGAVPDGQGPA